MYKSQRIEEYEAFGTFCHRVGIPAVEEFIKTYEPGSWKTLPDQFVPALIEPTASVGIDAGVLAMVEEEARARGYDAATLLDCIVREALDIEEE